MALLTLAGLGAVVTGLLAPEITPDLIYEYGLTLFAAGVGLWASVRASVDDLGRGLVILAAALSLLLLTPLGVQRMGAHRHVQLGSLVLQPSVFWVLACHATAVAVALGRSRSWPWLAAALAGAATAAFAMPELSIIPQVVAGLLVIAWSTGRRRMAMAALTFIIVAIAATALIPYVRRRWVGFLDPDSHARGAGYDYRALERLVARCEWLGPPREPMPRTSSPADDYWLASGMWRLGKLPMLAWVGALLVTLRGVRRYAGHVNHPGPLFARAIVVSSLTSLAIHAGYNLGLWPVTAISAPFSGIIGGGTAVTLFGLCFGIGSSLDDAVIYPEDRTHTTGQTETGHGF